MENEMMQQVLIFTTLLTPIVTALVQLVKNTVTLPNNGVPAVSLILGLVIGALSSPFTDMDLTMRLWAGAFAGLGGTGLYEVLNTRDGKTK